MRAVVLLLAMWNPFKFLTSHSVALEWKASQTSGVSYSVYRSVDGGRTYVRRASGVSGLGWKDGTVKSGKRYWYLVRAVKKQVESADSNRVEVLVP